MAGPTLAALGSFDPYPDYKLNLSGFKVRDNHGGKPVSGGTMEAGRSASFECEVPVGILQSRESEL